MDTQVVDHLFRRQYGRMVAVLTRFFGLSHLETIEDAVQDTFVKATLQWRTQIPDNPEAWLTRVAKNRVIDLLRKIQAEQNRFEKVSTGASAIKLQEMFLDHEIEDSELRMIFVACHPSLKPEEQICFALKSISGFSIREIATALLTKEETIKKRLARARQKVVDKGLKFEFPGPGQVAERLSAVMNVIYLTFNEGFHSTNQQQLIRQDLCGEAMRLCKLLLKRESLRTANLYALFGLMCFHAARLDSKIDENGEIVDLRNQDRSKWSRELMILGDDIMAKSMELTEGPHFSAYQIEAAIASEHLKADSFEHTNWRTIRMCYQMLREIQASPSIELNLAMANIQMREFYSAEQHLQNLSPDDLGGRQYLYFGCWAEFYLIQGDTAQARIYLQKAIDSVQNQQEKRYLERKLAGL